MRETGRMRNRWPILALLCVLASLLAGGTVSAHSATAAENRVWAFDLADQAHVGGAASLTLELRQGYELAEYDFASGSPLAAKGGSKIDRGAFRKEREAFWKAEAQNNPGKYSANDLAKMEKGRAPTGPDGHPMELHHVDRTPEGGVTPNEQDGSPPW